MNAPLRRVGVVVLILFGLLFANLNWVQGYKAKEYQNSPYNGRVQVAEYERQRGVIEAQGKALANSEETDGELKYLRKYPFKQLYAHVVGYKPVNLGAIDIESTENEFLSGTSAKLIADRVRDQFTGEETPGGNVLLTLSRAAQKKAYDDLIDNRVDTDRGALVALDPRSGAVQALVSIPSYDPNPLASHDTDAAEKAYKRLEQDKSGPLKNRALSEVLPPGSVFKVIDSAAALESGLTPDSPIPAGSEYQPPQTSQIIRNAHPSICPESQVTLKEALTESCNTGFSRLGVKLGADVLKAKARAFGFEDEGLTCGRRDGGGIPVAASRTGTMQRPDGQDDPPVVAQSAIGQREVKMTPMQGALIAAAVANNGAQMRPYLVSKLLGPDRTTTYYTASPDKLRQPVSDSVARDLQTMMISVVENGTGKNAQIDGFKVGGKTGTAQAGPNDPDHGWFIGFVFNKDNQPVSAVGVVLENAGPGGSAEAARIGGNVMETIVAGDRRGGE